MYLVGLHIYYKMIHGPYNTKLKTVDVRRCMVYIFFALLATPSVLDVMVYRNDE